MGATAWIWSECAPWVHVLKSYPCDEVFGRWKPALAVVFPGGNIRRLNS